MEAVNQTVAEGLNLALKQVCGIYGQAGIWVSEDRYIDAALQKKALYCTEKAIPAIIRLKTSGPNAKAQNPRASFWIKWISLNTVVSLEFLCYGNCRVFGPNLPKALQFGENIGSQRLCRYHLGTQMPMAP